MNYLAGEKSEFSSPYAVRAEATRAEIGNIGNLRAKIEEKQQEILEQKKLLQQKEAELQDAIWKEQALNKKIDKLQKNVIVSFIAFILRLIV
jgi:predicted transcriptional regulator